MNMTVLPMLPVSLVVIPWGLVKGQVDFESREEVVTPQTTTLLKLAWILRSVLETLEVFLVTQTSVRNYQLRLVQKTPKELKLIIIIIYLRVFRNNLS